MTGSDTTFECTDALDTQPTEMWLRYPDGQQQRLAMPAGKATLGAGAGCAVPIRFPGVGPLHCVLFPSSSGWRVRRWSSETLLNGGMFAEAAIEAGDRLQIGPVEVEFVGDELPSSPPPEREPVADEASSAGDEPIAPRDAAQDDVFDYVPVVKGADLSAEHAVLGERLAEHCDRLEELERQLAECIAQQDESRRGLGDLRQQIADVRHELAHAGQLDLATREAVLELERQLADWQNTPIVTPPSRPTRGFGLSRRVWPVGLRRRLIAQVRMPSEPIAARNGVDRAALAREEAESGAATLQEVSTPGDSEFAPVSNIECQIPIGNPPSGETVATEEYAEQLLCDEVAESAISPPQPFVEPESFLAKYQHLLKEESEVGEDAASVAASSPVGVPHESPPSTADDPGSPRSDDDSIEGYMARLLQRVRGESSGSSATTLANAVDTPATSSNSGKETPKPQRIVPAAPVPVSSLEEIKSAPAPERSRNMAALRDLANQSAHSAIHRANVRQHRESAVSKLSISLLGILCGIVVMKLSPSYTSPEFIGALVPLFAGLFWGGLTLVLLLRAIRDGSISEAKQSERLDKQIPPDVSADDL